MVSTTLLTPDLIKIYLDGQPVANAKTFGINRSKAVNKVPVIGTKDKRISEGVIELSGSLNGIKNSDTARRLVTSDSNDTDMQSKINATGSAFQSGGAAGANLLVNGGFETYTTTPGVPDSWLLQQGTAAQFTKEVTIKRTGSNAVRLTQPGSPAVQSIKQVLVGLVVGQPHYVEVWTRTGGATASPLMRIWNNTDNTQVTTDTFTGFYPTTGATGGVTFQKLSAVFTPAAGKTYELRLHSQATAVGDIVYFDDANVQLADINVGTANAVSVIQTGTLTFTQAFTALGTTLTRCYFNCSRNSAFTEDLTVTLKSTAGATLATFIVPNAQLPTSQDWAEYIIPLAQRYTALVAGTAYQLTFSVASTAGALSLYGNDVQTQYQIGTGNGATTAFTLGSTAVVSSTLYVAVGSTVTYKGQLEGYTFGNNTGAGGLDQVIFTTAPANGLAIYANYEFTASANLFAVRLGFSNLVTPSTYIIRIERFNTAGLLIDCEIINNVRFSKAGVNIPAGGFLEENLDFEGESETDIGL